MFNNDWIIIANKFQLILNSNKYKKESLNAYTEKNHKINRKRFQLVV